MNIRYLFLFLLLTSTGCKIFTTPEFRMPALLDVEVLRWKNNKPFIRTKAICYNQNNVGFNFKGGEVDIHLDTLSLGHAIIDTTFYVPAHTEFTVPAYLELDLVYLSQHGLKFDDTMVHIDGKFKGSVMGITKTLRITYTGKHNINLIMKPF